MTITKRLMEKTLADAVKLAKKNKEGHVANYIPELASVSDKITGIAVMQTDGSLHVAGNAKDDKFTLQSAAKLIVLIGMLEEFGIGQISHWCRVEPSGDEFSSVARLDQFGPLPSNPMLNSGAISLCGHIPGKAEDKLNWLADWVEKLFNKRLGVNVAVVASEKRTGDRNRSLAYLLNSNGLIKGDVESTLDVYFSLCSFEARIHEAVHLPFLLANHGKNAEGTQILKSETVKHVLSIMATCGLYNESGAHLVRTGMPAKSSVSGFILATVPKTAGVATISPRVNRKGTSLRGEIMLEHLSEKLDWHFAC